MKHGPVTKLDKTNPATSKTNDDDFISANGDVIVFFPIYCQSAASRIPNVWSIKRTFSLTATFYLTKPENRTQKSLTKLSYYCFE